MEKLEDTEWDVIISGTDLKSSLLALALSRSGKKILHVDQNEYYGGSNGALSLQEVESWVERIRSNELSSSSPFRDASVDRELEDNTREESLEIQATQSAKLSLSRAYTLSLSPFIIYTRSNLLPALVSSKTHQQLEFQVVGSWWVYERSQQATNHSSGSGQEKRDKTGVFRRVPNGREDVFSDKRIDLKAKRQLMKFLKFVVEYENQLEVWDEYRQQPFPAFLQSQFDLPSNLHAPLLALTLSLETPQNTLTSFAIPRIARHLRSIGKFGPGFGAVVPKWGGASEIAQVACRACAVGGGIYMLGQGIQHCSTIPVPSDSSTGQGKQEKRSRKQVHLANGESLQTRVFISTADQVPSTDSASFQSGPLLSRNVSIISTPLPSLLPALVEGSPLPAVAVVVFPSGSLLENDDHPPVYIMVHSSETGECPVDQCIFYSSTSHSASSHKLIDKAIELLLLDPGLTVESKSAPRILFSLRYSQEGPDALSCLDKSDDSIGAESLIFSPSSLDLAFPDRILDEVKKMWTEALKALDEDFEEDEFMTFDERDNLGDVDEEIEDQA